jgi:uncharacterized protein (DUF924 family)
VSTLLRPDELFHWRSTGEGRLAEILILDQFSRNIYRNRPQAFACDALALALAQEAVARGVDDTLTLSQRTSCTCRTCTVNQP